MTEPTVLQCFCMLFAVLNSLFEMFEFVVTHLSGSISYDGYMSLQIVT